MMRIVLIAAVLLAATAHAAFRCKDERGVTHFGDTPPSGCATVMMYEISKTGAVLREIAPTLTEGQLKARSDEVARLNEEQRTIDQQNRKDYALLATYGSEKDIDTSRDLNLKPIEIRLKSALARSAAVDDREKTLEAEKEFYVAGRGKSGPDRTRELPPQLKADFERIRQERTTLANAIAAYEKEMQEVRERFDADKRRWAELQRLKQQGKLDLRKSR